MITITGTGGNDTLSAYDTENGFSTDLTFATTLNDIAVNAGVNFLILPETIDGLSYALSNSGNSIALLGLGLNNQLVANELNQGVDVYTYNRNSTSLELITTRDDGTQPATVFNTLFPAFSPNDQQIAFISDSAFLDGVDTNSRDDLFVKNLVTGDMERVSDSASGVQGDGAVRAYEWLDDTTLLIDSLATNLVDGETYSNGAFYIKDIVTGDVSVLEFGGTSARDLIFTGSFTRLTGVSMSDDGRYFSFTSNMEFNGAANDGLGDIYVYDTVTEQFTRASTDSSGASANPLLSGNLGSFNSSISPNGNLVAFVSDAGNFVASDTNSARDIFLKDLITGETTRISVPNEGGEISQTTNVTAPKFSPDGTMIMFGVIDFFANSGGLPSGVYIYSVARGTLERIEIPTENGTEIPSTIFSDSTGINWLPDSSGILYTGAGFPQEILFTSDLTVGADISGLGGNDTITGSRNADTLSGGNGADILFGGDGNDILNGDNGADILNDYSGINQLNGGSGTDTISYEGSALGAIINLEARGLGGVGRRTSTTSNDDINTFTSIENATGSDNADTVYGNGGNNLLNGMGGNDIMFGRGGDDTLEGGDGEDFLDGGGDDELRGNLGSDILDGGDGNDLVLGGNSADTLDGRAGDDNIDGGGGNDIINGGTGNDELRGNVGSDIIDGGTGDDLILAGGGFDTLIGGNGADTLRGGNGDDILNGGNGDDNIAGQIGRDTLNGGAGDDIMTGGANLDTFVFDAANIGFDRIRDFVNGETMDLSLCRRHNSAR